jgi:hypothetical protein
MSLQSDQGTVCELKEELEDLNKVLYALQEIAINRDVDLSLLQLPLLRYGNAYKDFRAIVIKYTTHSAESKTRIRDWAKLRYIGDDMNRFKNMMARYKSTIMIVLSSVNM